MPKTKTLEPGASPVIPSMLGHIIFLDDLAHKDLQTYVQYSDIKLGHQVVAHWRGRSEAGLPVDDGDVPITISDLNFADGRLSLVIRYEQLSAIKGGEAFYSYEVLTPESANVGESYRLMCFIDRPGPVDTQLPVPQLRESHGLIIDLALVGTQAQVCAPPYQAMAVEDEVTLTWQGYRSADDSQPIAPWTQTLTIEQADVGSPLVWALPKSELRRSDGYHGTLSYSVAYASQRGASVSLAQDFMFGPLQLQSAPRWTTPIPPPRLGAPQLPDFSGSVLDPAAYPNGMRVLCPVYPRMLIGDTVFLHWVGANGSVIRSQQVDPSVTDSAKLEFVIDMVSLKSLGTGGSELFWQFARAGSGLTSDMFTLALRPALSLPHPLIDGINYETGTPEDEGYLRPDAIAYYGITVRVPEGAELAGARAELHWDGHENGGKFQVPGQAPYVFTVPPEYAAANMGNERFNVFYRALTDERQNLDSAPFRLLIQAPDMASLPRLVCTNATPNNELSLEKALASGAELKLNYWIFFSIKQKLYVRCAARTASGAETTFWVTDFGEAGQPITDNEVVALMVMLHVTKDIFNAFTVGTSLRFTVQVSFDGGESRIDFPGLTLELVG